MYEGRWKFFQTWCTDHQVDPLACPVESVLQFLQSLFEAGRTPSTLRVYVAALASYRARVDGSSLGAHRLIVAFIKGARRLRPPRMIRPPPWDLPAVLEILCRRPFEPLGQTSLKWLSLKTAFLLAVSSARRAGELHALSVSPLCMHWGIDDSSVRLRPNPTFLPKVLSPEFINQVIDLPAYIGSSDPRRQRLCPVRALRCYVTATAELRRSDQLFVCFSPGKLGSPLSKQRLSHWFIEVVKAAYNQAGQTLPLPALTRVFTQRCGNILSSPEGYSPV